MNDQGAIISENLQRIHKRIELAANAADRNPADVQLIAVSKYVDAKTTAALLDAGCTHLGESRPQQLWQKADEPTLSCANWHMIGHLQRNKVQRTVPLVDLIHSVDSLRLLRAIDEAANSVGQTQRILLEINTSGDEAKHGLTTDELPTLLQEAPNFPHVDICGLMTMAAREGGPAVAARNFATLRELRDQTKTDCPDGVTLHELSMGMSHDFEAAIREGATLVRIGSLLFEGLR